MGALVVVEGVSDQIALETLATLRGIDLASEQVDIVPLGGAQRIGRFVAELDGERDITALCDAAEEPIFRRALPSSAVHVCVADLEDELIRALGLPAAEEVLAGAGDLQRFRKLQQMPAWRGRPADQQLRRFIAAGARRKARYARLLVDALDLEHVPDPLDAVLGAVAGS